MGPPSAFRQVRRRQATALRFYFSTPLAPAGLFDCAGKEKTGGASPSPAASLFPLRKLQAVQNRFDRRIVRQGLEVVVILLALDERDEQIAELIDADGKADVVAVDEAERRIAAAGGVGNVLIPLAEGFLQAAEILSACVLFVNIRFREF